MKHTTSISAIILALTCTIFTSTGQLFYKLGSEKIVDFLSFFNLFVIIGIFSYFLGSILFVMALKKGELTVVAPMLSLNYVWVALLSITFLGETINLLRWAGIASVAVGVSIIGIGGRNGN
jgi:undecaprenyl phosphate-alpha-L-ara4N flippase subunit ArnE